jgi:hypothetical protein
VKGKQAASAANRRTEAAHQVIDRLTTELADTKMRAKEAERRAARLEGIEAMIKTADVKRDELVTSLTATVKEWKRVAERDAARREAATGDLLKVCDDVSGKTLAVGDKLEFLVERYPHLVAAVFAVSVETVKDWGLAGVGATVVPGTSLQSAESRILRDQGRESLARFQQLCGLRSTWTGTDKTSAQVVNDVLDAKQADLSEDEVYEYVFDKPSGSEPVKYRSGVAQIRRRAGVRPR